MRIQHRIREMISVEAPGPAAIGVPGLKGERSSVVVCAALHHYWDIVVALKHLKALLAPGGKLIIKRLPGKVSIQKIRPTGDAILAMVCPPGRNKANDFSDSLPLRRSALE